MAVSRWTIDPSTKSAKSLDFDGPVLAIEPFKNLSGGERWDQYVNAMTEDVTADLAEWTGDTEQLLSLQLEASGALASELASSWFGAILGVYCASSWARHKRPDDL